MQVYTVPCAIIKVSLILEKNKTVMYLFLYWYKTNLRAFTVIVGTGQFLLYLTPWDMVKCAYLCLSYIAHSMYEVFM
jgi:hypothetical protein